MNVDLSKSELDLLDEELKAWVREAKADGVIPMLMAGLLNPDKEEAKLERDKMTAETDALRDVRERQALLLRAKLIMAAESQTQRSATA